MADQLTQNLVRLRTAVRDRFAELKTSPVETLESALDGRLPDPSSPAETPTIATHASDVDSLVTSDHQPPAQQPIVGSPAPFGGTFVEPQPAPQEVRLEDLPLSPVEGRDHTLIRGHTRELIATIDLPPVPAPLPPQVSGGDESPAQPRKVSLLRRVLSWFGL